MALSHDQLAARAAREVRAGQYVHLGTGPAALVARHLAEPVHLRWSDATVRIDVAVVEAAQVSAAL